MVKDDGYRRMDLSPTEIAAMNVLAGACGPCRFDPRFHRPESTLKTKWIPRFTEFVRRKVNSIRFKRAKEDRSALLQE
ncbi:hypothetical protein QR680_000968 [Steinernema hermaphroditum]|uniref:Uncharacterized protein n=1 Tax=Steinernema hermaphroditum TaxID=289476 RepID=A0AA39GWI3_9BILA|nr:hypothetical protein QR680_000968 [Steinernema hermaphroditum]